MKVLYSQESALSRHVRRKDIDKQFFLVQQRVQTADIIHGLENTLEKYNEMLPRRAAAHVSTPSIVSATSSSVSAGRGYKHRTRTDVVTASLVFKSSSRSSAPST